MTPSEIVDQPATLEQMLQAKVQLRALIELDAKTNCIEQSHKTWLRTIYTNLSRRISKLEAEAL